MKLFLVVSAGVLAFASAHGGGKTDDLGRAAWMAGCWEMTRADRVIQEQWMAPRGAMMLGMSRTTVRDTVREYEFMRIVWRDGRATYVAHPSGQASAEFPAATWTDSLLVFTDLTHDFPQHITYRRLTADSLLAGIRGTMDGQHRSVDFPMRRVACVAGSR